MTDVDYHVSFLETHLECFRIGRSVRCGLQGLVESLIQILEFVFYELPGHLFRSFSSFVKEDWLQFVVKPI